MQIGYLMNGFSAVKDQRKGSWGWARIISLVCEEDAVIISQTQIRTGNKMAF